MNPTFVGGQAASTPSWFEDTSPMPLEALPSDLIVEYIDPLPCADCNGSGEHEQGICYCPAGAALWAEYEAMRCEQEDHRV